MYIMSVYLSVCWCAATAVTQAIVDQIKEFGQTPSQLFDRPHPPRRVKPGARAGMQIPSAPSTGRRPSATMDAHAPPHFESGKRSRLGRLGGLTGKLPFKQIVSAVKGGFGIHREAQHDGDDADQGSLPDSSEAHEVVDGPDDESVDAAPAPAPHHLTPLRSHPTVDDVGVEGGDADDDASVSVQLSSAPNVVSVEEGSTPLPCIGVNAGALISVRGSATSDRLVGVAGSDLCACVCVVVSCACMRACVCDWAGATIAGALWRVDCQ